MAVILKRSFCILIGLQSVSLSAAGTKGNGGKIVVGAEKVSELEDHETRHYTGQVVSKATVNIVARVSGEILEIGFRDGEFVRAGQMLCKRDPVQYEAAVKGAEARLKNVRLNWLMRRAISTESICCTGKQASSLNTI